MARALRFPDGSTVHWTEPGHKSHWGNRLGEAMEAPFTGAGRVRSLNLLWDLLGSSPAELAVVFDPGWHAGPDPSDRRAREARSHLRAILEYAHPHRKLGVHLRPTDVATCGVVRHDGPPPSATSRALPPASRGLEPAVERVHLGPGFPVDLELIYVDGGRLRMGFSETDSADERPVHTVHLSPFLIGRLLLTVGELRALGYQDPPRATPDGPRPLHGDDDDYVRDVRPVDVEPYLARHGLRFPTEAEWEFAGRGPTVPDDRLPERPHGRVPLSWRDDVRARWRLGPPPSAERWYVPAGVGQRLDRSAANDRWPSWCGAIDLLGALWQPCADAYRAYPTGDTPRWDPCPAGDDDPHELYVLRGDCYARTSAVRELRWTRRGANHRGWAADWDGVRVAASLDDTLLWRMFQLPDRQAFASRLDEARRYLEGASWWGHTDERALMDDIMSTQTRWWKDTTQQGEVFLLGRDGRVVRHRAPGRDGRPWRVHDPPLMPMILAQRQIATSGEVRWVDDLDTAAPVPAGERTPRSVRARRVCRAAWTQVPGRPWLVVIEVRLFLPGGPEARPWVTQRPDAAASAELDRWFERAGWLVDTGEVARARTRTE